MSNRLSEIANTLSLGINLETIKEIAYGAAPLVEPEKKIFPRHCYPKVKIGLALDEAFSFYYQDSIELWESYGAQFIPFSPLKDVKLPEGINGIYIGGGFPEMYIYHLADNKSLMQEIRSAAKDGMPIYAECGGLMYLTQAVVNFDGKEFPLVGLVPAKCIMEKRLVGMGYVEAQPLMENLISTVEENFRGHEFHYSRLEPQIKDYPWAYKLKKSMDSPEIYEGYVNNNILASYVHVHMANKPILAERFLEKCKMYHNGGKK